MLDSSPFDGSADRDAIDTDCGTDKQSANESNTASQYHFERSLLSRLQKKKPRNAEELIDLMAELVALNLPLFALKLQTLNNDLLSQSDFTALLIEGAAHMQNGDYVNAKQIFMQAHALAPDETAVHANMATMLAYEEALPAAQVWIEQGLQIDLVNANLWAIAAQLYPAAELWQLLAPRQAWMGASVYQQLHGEHERVLAVYRHAYEAGECSDLFMVAYTGTLGELHNYAELCKVAWQMTGEPDLSSQLCTHFAQAFAAQQNEQQAKRWYTMAKMRERMREKTGGRKG